MVTKMYDLDSAILSSNELEESRYGLEESGLPVKLESRLKIFDHIHGKSSHGKPYGPGTISLSECVVIYALIRKYQPKTIVETGVCNGYSTSFILYGINQNDSGHLWSIDFPEEVGTNYTQDTFWNGKGGASIPSGRKSGWIIPDHLKNRWNLIYGKSQDLLEPLLVELGTINFAFHDSEHTYDCMAFELEMSYSYMKNGIIIIDDTHHNRSFTDFCMKEAITPHYISNHMGMIIKGDPNEK